jgi:hypothetical protein
MSKNDATDQQHFQLNRAQVLKRLWEIANLSPEMTRNSITGQVKALSMIVAIESLIPDRRAAAADKNAVSPPDRPQIYRAAWLDDKEAMAAEPQPQPHKVRNPHQPSATITTGPCLQHGSCSRGNRPLLSRQNPLFAPPLSN